MKFQFFLLKLLMLHFQRLIHLLPPPPHSPLSHTMSTHSHLGSDPAQLGVRSSLFSFRGLTYELSKPRASSIGHACMHPLSELLDQLFVSGRCCLRCCCLRRWLLQPPSQSLTHLTPVTKATPLKLQGAQRPASHDCRYHSTRRWLPDQPLVAVQVPVDTRFRCSATQ